MREFARTERQTGLRSAREQLWVIASPFVLAILPALDLWWHNRTVVSFGEAAIVMCALVVATAAGLWAMTRVPSWQPKAILLLSSFWVWWFSYDGIRRLLATAPFIYEVGRHRYLIPAWLCVFAIEVSLVSASKRNLRTINRYVAASALVVLASQLTVYVTSEIKKPITNGPETASLMKDVRLDGRQTAKPDIYYIILDAYSGRSELKRVLGFDNGPFVQYLETKGFYVPRRSYSNYSWTLLSMAATLNLNYLPTEVAESGAERVPDDLTLETLIADSSVVRALRRAGYSYVDMSIARDEYIEPFATALAKTTLLSRPIVENLIEGNIRRVHVLRKLEELKTLRHPEGPVFVYAHLLIPHHPYIFDRDGNSPPWIDRVMQMRPEQELYLDQVRFANAKIREVVDALLSKDGPPPIVIVQGDHGTGPFVSSAEANRRLRMGILNAYYVPDTIRPRLYDSITPVNTFRLILNELGADLPLLKDRRYFSTAADFRGLIAFDLPAEE